MYVGSFVQKPTIVVQQLPTTRDRVALSHPHMISMSFCDSPIIDVCFTNSFARVKGWEPQSRPEVGIKTGPRIYQNQMSTVLICIECMDQKCKRALHTPQSKKTIPKICYIKLGMSPLRMIDCERPLMVEVLRVLCQDLLDVYHLCIPTLHHLPYQKCHTHYDITSMYLKTKMHGENLHHQFCSLNPHFMPNLC